MTQTSHEQSKNTRYRTYLLTCWQEVDSFAGTKTWRFRLETLDTGRCVFELLQDVMAWIERELGLATRDG